MQMPTNKNLDGSDIAKDKNKDQPSPRITVYFKKRMNFDGKNADFHGAVQALQQGSRSKMLCEHLTTCLDRFVSFKDGQKPGPDGKKDAKIDRIICYQNVFIDDIKVDEKARPPVLVQQNMIEGHLLDHHEDGRTDITGPGRCRQLSQGTDEPTFGSPQPGAQPKSKSNADGKGQWTLTDVRFPAHMFYCTDEKIKKATFWADAGTFVEVFHFPTIHITDKMDPDHPPKDGLYLRSENLVVRGEEHGDRTTQIMIARQNVYFRTDTYTGYCDVLKYDENADMVTMECSQGKLVQLYKLDATTGRPTGSDVRSAKVLYNRKTGEITTTGVKSITN